jgi:hypothetical protein
MKIALKFLFVLMVCIMILRWPTKASAATSPCANGAYESCAASICFQTYDPALVKCQSGCSGNSSCMSACGDIMSSEMSSCMYGACMVTPPPAMFSSCPGY